MGILCRLDALALRQRESTVSKALLPQGELPRSRRKSTGSFPSPMEGETRVLRRDGVSVIWTSKGWVFLHREFFV